MHNLGGGLLLPPLEREVDDGNYDEVAAGGTPAAIGTWAKVEAVDAAPAIFSDAGARTWIFLGRFFCARSKRFIRQIFKKEFPQNLQKVFLPNRT